MKRIILHWTAGTWQPSSEDYEHYHYLINGDGLIIKGKYRPEDNINCKDGRYAAHTAMGNTGSIGVAFCGMRDYTIGGHTDYPLTLSQCMAGFKLVAELCKKYNIEITKETVLTHHEFDCKRGYAGRKIDIVHLHPFPEIITVCVGDFIRQQVKAFSNILN
jgi:N-acetyl-anhydromuramyl-L-alanine amidase AmpD